MARATRCLPLVARRARSSGSLQKSRDPAGERRGVLGLDEGGRLVVEHVAKTREVAHDQGKPARERLEDLEGRGVGADPRRCAVGDDADVGRCQVERDVSGWPESIDAHVSRSRDTRSQGRNVAVHPADDQHEGAGEPRIAGRVHEHVHALPTEQSAGVQHDGPLGVEAEPLPRLRSIRQRSGEVLVDRVVLHRHVTRTELGMREILRDARRDGDGLNPGGERLGRPPSSRNSHRGRGAPPRRRGRGFGVDGRPRRPSRSRAPPVRSARPIAPRRARSSTPERARERTAGAAGPHRSSRCRGSRRARRSRRRLRWRGARPAPPRRDVLRGCPVGVRGGGSRARLLGDSPAPPGRAERTGPAGTACGRWPRGPRGARERTWARDVKATRSNPPDARRAGRQRPSTGGSPSRTQRKPRCERPVSCAEAIRAEGR